MIKFKKLVNVKWAIKKKANNPGGERDRYNRNEGKRYVVIVLKAHTDFSNRILEDYIAREGHMYFLSNILLRTKSN